MSIMGKKVSSFQFLRDKYHRWQRMEFRKKGRFLQIINVYSPVCNKKVADSVCNQLRNRMVSDDDFRETRETFFSDVVSSLLKSIEQVREIKKGRNFNDAMSEGSYKREEFLYLELQHLTSTFQLENLRT